MAQFICDVMLGSLARWLRLFGYDCSYPGTAVDEELALTARDQGRWLLTRDGQLAALGPRTMLVRAEALEEQLREVFERLELTPEPTLAAARCSACNGDLVAVARAEVADRVPPYVARTGVRFRLCNQCGRVYWPGTHGRKIIDRMERVCSPRSSADSAPGPSDNGSSLTSPGMPP